MKKYELIESDKVLPSGKPLFQVVALRDFGFVKKGDKGGYIESDANLSHEGDCWVFDDAQVYGGAQVTGDAQVYDDARVYGAARVFDDASVSGNAQVSGTALVCADVWVATSDPVSQPELTNGSVSPAQMDTTEYPPEGQNEECDHPMHRYRIMHDPSHCPKCGKELQ